MSVTVDTTRPRLIVPAPTLQQLPYGLLTVANEVQPGDEHAGLGVQFEPLDGLTGGIAGIDATGAQIGALSPETFATGEFPTIFTNPFLIYAGVQARPVGHTEEEIQARATAKLALQAGRLIEQGLWSGTPSADNHLNAADTADLTPVAGTAVSVDLGIGLLERWIGDTVGAQGMIHASRVLGGALWNQVHAQGPRMLTTLGTPVAFGAGYDGSGPNAVAAASGQTWLYATGVCSVFRGEVLMRTIPAAQRASYASGVTSTAYATEIVSVGIEGGIAAVLVNIT